MYYDSVEQFYQIYGTFFDTLNKNNELGPTIADVNVIARFECPDLPSQITIDFKNARKQQNEYFKYIFGESELEPDVTIIMNSDMFHKFWHGKVNIMTAVTTRKIKVKGNLRAAMNLLPKLKPVYQIFPEVLRELGYEEKILQ